MRKHIPNLLSITRAVLSVVLLLLLIVPHPLHLAQWIFGIALVSDKLDGTLARWWKVESELGKRLESLVDPLFALACALYIVLLLDYPREAFFFGVALLVIVMCTRIFVSLQRKKLFYEKSPITRYGVGLIYLNVVFFFFQLPYRHAIVWPIMAYGVFGFFNYMRMLVRAYRKPSM